MMGIMVRITGDTMALSPPLIVSEREIGEIAEKVKRLITAVAIVTRPISRKTRRKLPRLQRRARRRSIVCACDIIDILA